MGLKIGRKIIDIFKKMYYINKYDYVIISMDGGFGSNFIRYAIGKSFEKKFGIKVKYDLTWYDEYGMDCDNKFKRKFEFTNVFPNIEFEVATLEEIDFYKRYFSFKNKQIYKYNTKLLAKKRPLYTNSYFVHWKYFDYVKEELLKDLDFSYLKLNVENEKILDEIVKKDESVAVHVRRGDFVNIRNYCILNADYYISAINLILTKKDKPSFYFFSDDTNWVRENIINKLPKEVSTTIVDVNDNDTGYFDLFLISKCKHQILSNSSFSFVAAFLNQNSDKIVIMPEKWTKNNEIGSDTSHRVPGWIVLPC